MPARQNQRSSRGVEVTNGTIDNPANFCKPRVTTTQIYRSRSLRNPRNWISSIGVPHQEKLVRAAADIAELQMPIAGDCGLPTEIVLMRIGCDEMRVEHIGRAANIRVRQIKVLKRHGQTGIRHDNLEVAWWTK